MRIALFVRIVAKHIQVLLDAVFATQRFKKSWSSSVLKDLRMLSSLELHPLFSAGSAFSCLEEWQHHLACNCKVTSFLRALAKALAHPVLNCPPDIDGVKGDECARPSLTSGS